MQQQKLKLTHFSTPLFAEVFKANPVSSDGTKKFLFLNSPLYKPEIYHSQFISDAVQSQSQSFIQLNGICLDEYLKSKNREKCVFSEEEVWCLLDCLIEAFITIHGNDCQVTHLKQYCIRRISATNYELIYHVKVQSQLKAVKSGLYNWYDFYLSPQELIDEFKSEKSIIFSLGALVLNICAHQDRGRTIYRQDTYQIDQTKINQKLQILKYYYSRELWEIVDNCLQLPHQDRPNFSQLKSLMSKKREKIENKKVHVVSQFYPSQITYDLKLPKENKEIKEVRTPKRKGKVEKPLGHRLKKSWEGKEEQKKEKYSQVKENISQFQYRGTFGSRYENEEKREDGQSESEHKPVSLSINLVNKPDQLQQNRRESKEREESPETPKGFNTNYFAKIHSQESEKAPEKQELPPLQIVSRNSFGKNSLIPVPSLIQQIHSLKLQICLLPLDQLKMLFNKPGVYINGDLYFGELLNGRRHGLGLEIFQNDHEYYYGYFDEDLFHGEGFYFWNSAEYFFGEFSLGQKYWGRLEGPVKYQGFFKGNKRHGEGCCWYKTGQIYIGSWQNGKRDGKGTCIDQSGEKFVGTWEKGKRFGDGYLETQYLRIAGFWKGQQTHGEVFIQYKNGDVFTGILNCMLSKVEGEYISKSGRSFKGKFDDDEPSQGVLTYSNGEKYKGKLKNNKRHGYGQYYYLDGNVWKGQWHDNYKTDQI